MARVSVESLVGAALLLLAQALVLAWRWQRIVGWLGGSLAPAKALQWVFVGLFFNQVLPTSIGGDAFRVWCLHREGSARGVAFASVASERGTGVMLLSLMIVACLPAVWSQFTPVLRGTLLATGPAVTAVLALLAVADRLPSRWIPSSLLAPAMSLASALRRLAGSPRPFAGVAILGLGSSFIGLLAAYVLGVSLGIAQSLPVFVVCVGGAVLLSVLPISLGGWGVRELGMVGLFEMVGTPAEQGLALSVIWGALMLVVALPGGVLWVSAKTRRAVAAVPR